MTVRRGEVSASSGERRGQDDGRQAAAGLSRPERGEGRVLGAPIGDLPRGNESAISRMFRYQLDDGARGARASNCSWPDCPARAGRPALDEALGLVGSGGPVERPSRDVLQGGCSSALDWESRCSGSPSWSSSDKPTSALDPVGRQERPEIIRSLRDRGVTVFLTRTCSTESGAGLRPGRHRRQGPRRGRAGDVGGAPREWRSASAAAGSIRPPSSSPDNMAPPGSTGSG